jgi:hypothetical protein
MAFTDVKQTVACAPDSNTARVCKTLWTDWQVEVLVGVGGAPLESVPDWQSLDLAEPEPMTGRPTLSSPVPEGRALVAQPGSSENAPPPAEKSASGSCAVARGDAAVSGAIWCVMWIAAAHRLRKGRGRTLTR